MLIGIDASRAVAARPTGTEVYSQRVIEALLALDSPHRFRLYLRSAPPASAFPGADLRLIPCPRLWTHLRLSWEMARRPPDALFIPAHVLPLVHPRASLVTVHDLGYLHFPEAHPWRQRLYLDLSTRWNARAATHIMADSEATKSDLVAHYGVPPDKITVAYPGCDESLAPVRDPATIEAVKTRHGITGDYFLYLGTLQPRKNLSRLITAFATQSPSHPTRSGRQARLALRRPFRASASPGPGGARTLPRLRPARGQGRPVERGAGFCLSLALRGVRPAGAGSPCLRLPGHHQHHLEPARGGRGRGAPGGPRRHRRHRSGLTTHRH